MNTGVLLEYIDLPIQYDSHGETLVSGDNCDHSGDNGYVKSLHRCYNQ